MPDSVAFAKPAYTLDEFSEWMHIPRSRIWIEIRECRLQAVRAGALVLIPAPEITAWLGRLPPARTSALGKA